MHIYRDCATTRGTGAWIDELIWRALTIEISHDTVRDFLVDCGTFEAALVDALCPHVDRWDSCVQLVRELTRQLAGAFVRLINHIDSAEEHFPSRTLTILERLRQLELPTAIRQNTPEGFAYYGLFPEQYGVAAQRAMTETCPASVVVIGLRSIGTTLSCVVESTLALHRVPVTSYTVRPRGPPFNRGLCLDETLVVELQRAVVAGAHFFVVDEGPGLSGSSFTSVVESLVGLSAPRQRIVLFPSYRCDARRLQNVAARSLWDQHRSFVADFERSWIHDMTADGELLDLSAGAWRGIPTLGASRVALCHPQHERRKFMTLDARGAPASVMRFAGFGTSGQNVRERAERLSNSGVTPRAVGFGSGMLVLEFISGRRLRRNNRESGILSTITHYLEWRAKQFQISAPSNTDALFDMTCHNTELAIGSWAIAAIRDLKGVLVEPEALTIVDGRMAPNEWLCTDSGLKKLDAFDHGDDHFFPGPCDIAWDIAGLCVEFGATDSQIGELIDAYAALSHDQWIGLRLPFYLSAYRAYRIGYCHWASIVLPHATARSQFRRRALWYRLQLANQLHRCVNSNQPMQY